MSSVNSLQNSHFKLSKTETQNIKCIQLSNEYKSLSLVTVGVTTKYTSLLLVRSVTFPSVRNDASCILQKHLKYKTSKWKVMCDSYLLDDIKFYF